MMIYVRSFYFYVDLSESTAKDVNLVFEADVQKDHNRWLL